MTATRGNNPTASRTTPASTLAAIIVLVGLEIALIAVLTAIGISGAPAVITVVAFALAERIAYVKWFKNKA
jgi:hypothetical protein